MAEAPRDDTATADGGPPRVEVVADQTQDGAYEIRLEATAPHPMTETTGTRLTAVESRTPPGSGSSKARVVGVAAVSVAAVVGAGVAVTNLNSGGEGRTPNVQAPERVDGFNSFVVEPPSERTLPSSVFTIDSGAGAEPDAGVAFIEPEPSRVVADDEPSRAAAPPARRVSREALTPRAPEPRSVDGLRAVPVDRQLLQGNDEYEEYDEYDEYEDEYEDEYGDEYDDDYE